VIEYAFREGAVHGPVFDETHVGEWSEEQAGLELHVGAGAEDAGCDCVLEEADQDLGTGGKQVLVRLGVRGVGVGDGHQRE
jgi:hypothetical protein